jgi:hypothetical protein
MRNGSFLAVQLAFFGLLVALAVSPAHGAATEPYGLDSIIAVDRLPFLKIDTIAGGTSSYERNGENKDGDNNWMYWDDQERVLCELKGPGVIYRMWFTGYEAFDCNFKIYFDGEATPRLNLGSVFDMQTNGYTPFFRPLIRDWYESSGGHPTYVPIPFNESIKITSQGTNARLFYNINYHLFSPDTTVQSWTGAEDRTAANQAWDPARMTLDPKSTAENTTVAGTASIAAGSSATMLDVDGPRSISSIKVKIGTTTPTATQLNSTWLRIYWDNETTPSVDAPLGSFFAIGEYGVGIKPKSIMVGLDATDNLYCYFPMPFYRHARVELRNAGATSLSNVTYEVQHKAQSDFSTTLGYFKTQYTATTPSTAGNDLVFLDTTGSGHLVGVVQSVSGPFDRTNLEGDERFYVDGRRTPALQGTGTEDFYNGGWYFNGGLVTWPIWGFTQHLVDTQQHHSMYRLFLQDTIPFKGSIRAGIEHGGANEVSVDAWTLAYYYHSPEKLELTDTLDVGNASSETAHGYGTTGVTSATSLTDTFEGDNDDVAVTEDGRFVDGSSEFTLAIAPINAGVVLRRMLDQNTFNQNAEVYVDDAYVGNLLAAGGNIVHRWKETDFMIPASFTRGKSAITVRLEPLSDGISNGDQLFSDGFESGALTAGGWVTGGAAVGTSNRFHGVYAAALNATDFLTKSLSTVGYENIAFAYCRRTRDFDASGDNLYVEWSDNGGATWAELEHLVATSAGYGGRRFILPVTANNNPNVQVRFRMDTDSTGDYGYLDDIVITGEPIAATPTKYWNEFQYQAYSVLTPLMITTNGGADFEVAISPVTVAGVCTSDTTDILVNGESIGHTPGATTWTVVVDIACGTNELRFVALDDRGVPSGEETLVVTLPDADGDDMPTAWEEANGTDPNIPDADDDPDGDGLTNAEEYAASTHPLLADTDSDGVSDRDEVIFGYDPNSTGSTPDLPVGTGAALLLMAAMGALGYRRRMA